MKIRRSSRTTISDWIKCHNNRHKSDCTPGRRSSRPGFIIMVGALLVFVTAIIGVAVNMSGFLDVVYMDLTLTLPKFDYKITNGMETGNETFEAFQQMRFIGAGVLGVALVYAGIVRFLENESAGIVQRGISNQIIANSLTFVIFFVAFPPMWDIGADMMDNLATWVLNPLYSFDPDRPCPIEWYDTPSIILEEYNNSQYKTHLSGWSDTTTDVDRAEFVCEPGFKVRYVFDQMMGTTDVERIESAYMSEGLDLENLLNDLESFASEKFVNVFLGLTKALVTINVLILAFVIGIMTDVLIGMIIAALPIFLFMTLIPNAKNIANRFVDALPALFLLPLLSATVIVVGASFLADVQDDGADETENTILYKWVAAIGIVFLAVSLPVILVPMLGSATSMATQAVTSGIQTSAMVTGMAATGALRGIRQGAVSGKDLHGLSRLGTIAAAGSTGLGHGLLSASAEATKGTGFGGAGVTGNMQDIGRGMEGEYSGAAFTTKQVGKFVSKKMSSRQSADMEQAGDSDAGDTK